MEGDGSDFPIFCETCLGDNPFVRMTRVECDKECKICTRRFPVFRCGGGRNARLKTTEICQTCSKLKNVCQVCNLKHGRPVWVRYTLLSTSYARRERTRGADCPYSHELSQQNIRDRYYGVHDPVVILQQAETCIGSSTRSTDDAVNAFN